MKILKFNESVEWNSILNVFKIFALENNLILSKTDLIRALSDNQYNYEILLNLLTINIRIDNINLENFTKILPDKYKTSVYRVSLSNRIFIRIVIMEKGEGYENISYSENHSLYKNLIKFKELDFNTIKNNIKCDSISYKNGHTHLYPIDGGWSNVSPMVVIKFKNIMINIVKKDDEWFLVEVFDVDHKNISNRKATYYKCDQLYGVINLINKIFNI